MRKELFYIFSFIMSFLVAILIVSPVILSFVFPDIVWLRTAGALWAVFLLILCF